MVEVGHHVKEIRLSTDWLRNDMLMLGYTFVKKGVVVIVITHAVPNVVMTGLS